MRIRCLLRIVAFAALAVLPRVARGQGFGLNDIGSCAVARGYATTGAPCRDASTIYWNPGRGRDAPRALSLPRRLTSSASMVDSRPIPRCTHYSGERADAIRAHGFRELRDAAWPSAGIGGHWRLRPVRPHVAVAGQLPRDDSRHRPPRCARSTFSPTSRSRSFPACCPSAVVP